jgi:hypothetical protein
MSEHLVALYVLAFLLARWAAPEEGKKESMSRRIGPGPGGTHIPPVLP